MSTSLGDLITTCQSLHTAVIQCSLESYKCFHQCMLGIGWRTLTFLQNEFNMDCSTSLATLLNDVKWGWMLFHCHQTFDSTQFNTSFVLMQVRTTTLNFLAGNCKQCWTNAHAGNINLGNSITFNIVQREGQTWSTTLIQQCHIMIFRDVKFVWLPYITQHRTTKFYSTVLVDVESVCQIP